MLYAGTDPESYITQYTLAYEDYGHTPERPATLKPTIRLNAYSSLEEAIVPGHVPGFVSEAPERLFFPMARGRSTKSSR